MRIDHGPNPIDPHSSPSQSQLAAQRATRSTQSSAGQTSTAIDLQSIDNLLKVLADSSEIRESVVNEVKLKIETGEFLVRQAAVDTASAILEM